MGITDEDYAAALIKQHMEAHKAYLEKQMKEKQMARTSAVVNDTNTITSTNTGITLNTNAVNNMVWSSGPTGVKVIDERDLQHDAMKAPLSSLVDMWVVRWGGEWVGEGYFQEDDFWRLALIRLVGANKLEKHNLANHYNSVYRIIE